MSNIQLNSRVIADIEPQRVYGKKGLGIYRLQFEFNLNPYSRNGDTEQLIVSNFNTEIYVNQKGKKENQKIYLGRAIHENEPLVFKITDTNHKT